MGEQYAEKETPTYTVIVEVEAAPDQAFSVISEAAFSLSQSAQIVGGYDCIERIEAAAKTEAREAARLDVRREIEQYRGSGDHWRMTFARLIKPSSIPPVKPDAT